MYGGLVNLSNLGNGSSNSGIGGGFGNFQQSSSQGPKKDAFSGLMSDQWSR